MMTFACTAIAGLAIVLAAETTGPRGGDFGEPRVVVAAPADARSAHLSWPKIVTTPNGNLVAAFSAGIGHNIGSSGPAVSVSTDRGATFSPPRLLRRFPEDDDRYDDCGNMALGLADDGAVVLLAMAYRGDEANTIFGWRSEDEGASWEQIDTRALAENRTGSVYGHVFSVPGRGLAVAGHYRSPSQPHAEGIWVAFSKDGGRSWGAAERVAERRLFEPAVVFVAGRFVGLIRDGASTPPYWQLVGDGERWSLEPSPVRPTEAKTRLRAPSPFLVVDADNPSRLWALESQRFGGEGGGAIWLWSADATALDWQRLGLVIEFPAGNEEHVDFTYPWMSPLGDGRWFLVFYSGRRRGTSAIYGMELDLRAVHGTGNLQRTGTIAR